LLGRLVNALLLLLALPIMTPDRLSYRGCSSWPGSFESREPNEGTHTFFSKLINWYHVVRSPWAQMGVDNKQRKGRMKRKKNGGKGKSAEGT
jgi:hypothetical protein